MRQLLTALNLMCSLLVLFMLFSSGFEVNTPPGDKVQQYVSQVPMPPSIAFANEEVPLYDREVRERLDREITNVTHQHSSTIRVMKLAYRYLPLIEDILSRNGVPDDFKYLAIAESGLENVTSSKGAKGVWQFMEGTATQYGLEISTDVDERLHLEKSTLAACTYLRNAYQRFGTWTMAAASYNRGVSGMNEHAGEQQSNNYYDLYLNSETSRYIFRILAYKHVLTHPEDYGYHFTTEDFYPAQATNSVMISSIGDIAAFARSYNTNYKTVKNLNPWLRTNSLKGRTDKSYAIKLPM
ncbi:murein transglycosylase [Sphingobacteriales bacterium UPWRP_1]|nr:hypothetical protein BVG80_15780 [Sphingobacteriales bacterium TSM_CSM]PSJ75043.1 murein transglycosylase [Sphingobacteriales bacterium UPWRP_1]